MTASTQDSSSQPARGDRLRVRTDPQQRDRAKDPWTGIELVGEIESDYLYATVLEITPYKLGQTKLLALPLNLDALPSVEILSAREVARVGAPRMSSWLEDAAGLWEDRRGESRSQSVEIQQYLNNQSNLTRQRLRDSVFLLYGGKGTHVRAAVIDTRDVLGGLADLLPRGFVVDMNMYAIDAGSANAAHYLAAVLNTPYVDEAIKATQTQGAFGARDIHRRPFEVVAIPEFDAATQQHARLVEISMQAHATMRDLAPARTYAAQMAPVSELVDEASEIVSELCDVLA